MGRGVSEQQKEILKMAYKNLVAEMEQDAQRKLAREAGEIVAPTVEIKLEATIKKKLAYNHVPPFAPPPIFKPAYRHYIKNRLNAHLYTSGVESI
jgi:hypothetical protein